VEKVAQNAIFKNNLSKISNNSLGEKSPNLVTLADGRLNDPDPGSMLRSTFSAIFADFRQKIAYF
jgi:hypothetical protein